MNRLSAFLVPLILLSAGCQDAPEKPPLAGASMGGPFSLTSETGKPFSDRDLTGQYRLVYFGFTFCPDVCPVDVAKLMKGFAALEARNPKLAGQIQPLFITIDPKRDTAAALTQFTDAFHARLIGLTGTPAQIADVAKRYGVYFEIEPGKSATDYNVNHSRTAVLYGKTGEPLAIIGSDAEPEVIADELERWAR